MREVNFVMGLKVERRRVVDMHRIEYHLAEPLGSVVPIGNDGEMLLAEMTVKSRVVPIQHLRGLRGGRSDTYLAYTREVEELLELPFAAMSAQIEAQEALLDAERRRMSRVLAATLWERVLFLIFKRVPSAGTGRTE